MSSFKLKLAAFGAALFLALPAAPALAQAGKAPAKLTFRLDWKPSGAHAPFYIGKALGYYAEEGIDLEIISGSGSSDSVKQLGANAVDMALVDGLVLAQAGEQRVPIKSVAAYYTRTPIAVISPKAKPITSAAQLTSGAKIGSKRASSTYQGLTALLAVNKIDPKRVNIVDIGFGVQPLLVGQVDALMGFTMNEAIEAESAGMPVHEMLIADQGVVAYGLTLASGDRFLKAKPELVRAFLRATRRAVQYTATHQQEAVAALAKSVSEMDPARELKVLGKAMPFWSVQGQDLSSFGTQSLEGWQQTVETAQRVGLVEKAPAAKDLFADGFLK
ncbi:MAG: ABC transporter substrate-binding protein [Pigmentiphaga sp.]|uniref:ABC transporter substrate-binding protein n=1 Tax=Pigmentiphaga sp. TaxID=1977564 RepID=UPI0029AEB935|nr:ABC transporter substrate-binding protein [Pigmentiphaga sp.]MDX3905998.1 ABC transporter substrate-binding protein [Pigmentiphaga sp.]